jgi:competence protein ComEA
MMLSTLLVRLAMVALTMAVVCWIGWKIPASRHAEALHAASLVETAGPPPLPVPPTKPLAPPTPLQERRPQNPAQPFTTISLDVNRASQQDFERLPGIGPVLAGRIIEYREARGGFRDIEQLRRVKGIGKKTFERIREFVAIVSPVSRPARKTA